MPRPVDQVACIGETHFITQTHKEPRKKKKKKKKKKKEKKQSKPPCRPPNNQKYKANKNQQAYERWPQAWAGHWLRKTRAGTAWRGGALADLGFGGNKQTNNKQQGWMEMSGSTQTSGGKHCNTRAEGEMNANRPFSIPMSMSAHLHLHYRANLFNSRKHYCMQLSQTGKSRRLLLLLLSVKERHVKAHRLQAILHKRRPVTREREKGGGEEVKREREKRGGEGVKRERDKGASIEKTPCTYSHAHTRTHTRTLAHTHARTHARLKQPKKIKNLKTNETHEHWPR